VPRPGDQFSSVLIIVGTQSGAAFSAPGKLTRFRLKPSFENRGMCSIAGAARGNDFHRRLCRRATRNFQSSPGKKSLQRNPPRRTSSPFQCLSLSSRASRALFPFFFPQPKLRALVGEPRAERYENACQSSGKCVVMGDDFIQEHTRARARVSSLCRVIYWI